MTVGRPAPGPQDATTPRRRPSGRGPLLVGLGLSLAVHLLFLVFYARLGAPIIPGVPFASPLDPSERAFDGTQVIRIVEVTGEPAAEAPETDPTSEPTSPDAVEPDQAPSDEREQGPALPGRPGRAAADVLRAQEEDSVIWRRVDPELARLTDLEEARLRLRWSAADWNAARDAEARAAREALDWTYTDEEGQPLGCGGREDLPGKARPSRRLPVRAARRAKSRVRPPAAGPERHRPCSRAGGGTRGPEGTRQGDPGARGSRA